MLLIEWLRCRRWSRNNNIYKADDGESTSRREWELVDILIRGGRSTGNTEELVVGLSIGGGEGEVRDHSESEALNKARASTFFLRVALDGSGSVAVLVPTSVSVLNSMGTGDLRPWRLYAVRKESRRALAFDALSWDIGVAEWYWHPIHHSDQWPQPTTELNLQIVS